MSLEQQIERVATGLEALNRILSSEMAGCNRALLAPLLSDEREASIQAPAKIPKPETSVKAVGKVVTAPAPEKAAEPSEEITNETLSKVTRDLLQRHGRDTVIGLLASIGATKASEIAQEYRAQYLADTQEMLKK